MLDIQDCTLHSLVVHWVGNKEQDESLKLSDDLVDITDESVEELLVQYFLSPYKKPIYYQFSHPSDLKLNEVYHYATKIFEDPKQLSVYSKSLASWLFEAGKHPNIKSGEFYVAYFDSIQYNGEWTDAIGLFKSESKETFLRVFPQGRTYGVGKDEGLNVSKLDKGCLIINTKSEEGYIACVSDQTSRSSELARYWSEDFLMVKPYEDHYYHTNNVLKLCKDFCTNVFSPDNDVPKTDQVLMMDRSMQYFTKHESFDIAQFEKEVMVENDIVQAFREYKQNVEEEQQIHFTEEFAISDQAVKKNKRFFKSVIKLDKNFHVYIHGNHDYVERGYDEQRGMRYYQLFYKEES